MQYGPVLLKFASVALRSPGLIPALLSAAWRFRSRDWYRRAPFLPVPRAEYVAWRLHTAYGSESAVPDAAELTRYLRWCAMMRNQTSPRP